MWNIRCMYILLNDCGIYLYFFVIFIFNVLSIRTQPPGCCHSDPLPGVERFCPFRASGALRAQIPRVLPWARRKLPFQGALIPIVFRRGGLGVHFPIVFRRGGLGVHFPIVFRRGGLGVHFPIAFRRMLIHWLATFTP